MRTFSRTPSFHSTNSPSLDKSAQRFSKLKQNLDIYNIRASNYKSALERTFERASHVEDYNYYGSIYQNFSTSSLSLTSKPSTSSPSFFSSNTSYLSSHSKRPAVRYNSNSAISPNSKNFTATPSSSFNRKWNSKIDSGSNYLYKPYDLYDYDIVDTNDTFNKSNRNTLNSFDANRNNLPNKPDGKKNPKKDKKNEVIFTPNRAQNQKRYIQENEDGINTTFEINKNDTFDMIEPPSDPKIQNIVDTSINIFEEEEEIEIGSNNQNDELEYMVEEEINEKKITKTKSDNTKEKHSQAYLNAMNAVNDKMMKFNNQLNNDQSDIKKSQASNNIIDINSSSSKSDDDDEIINEPIQTEEEDEFKKKQRVEIEEIKSLYALLENELKKIKEESNTTNSNSEVGNEVDANEEDLNEEIGKHSNSSS